MATEMNFGFWTLDEKRQIVDHSFSLPLGPLLFDEMRLRVLEIIQKTEQKFYWDDGFSRVSLNNCYDLEAAVNWSFQSSKISGNEPEVQIWFDSERYPSGLSIATYMRTFRSVASKAKNTNQAPIPYPLPILKTPCFTASAAVLERTGRKTELEALNVADAAVTGMTRGKGTDRLHASYPHSFKKAASNIAKLQAGQWNYLQRRRAAAEAKMTAEKEQEMEEREELLVASEQSNLGYFEDAHLDVAAYETCEEFDGEKDIALD